MDVYRIIADLMTERDRVQHIIESLETMLVTGAPPAGRASRGRRKGAAQKKGKRKGRPPMNAAERAAQSERMKALWAKRRAEKTAAE